MSKEAFEEIGSNLKAIAEADKRANADGLVRVPHLLLTQEESRLIWETMQANYQKRHEEVHKDCTWVCCNPIIAG